MTSKEAVRLFTALFVLGMGATAFLAPEARSAQTNVLACQREWLTSQAAQSCGVGDQSFQMSVTSGGLFGTSSQCSVTVQCSTSGQDRTASFTGSVNEMGRLHNCNGYLVLDGC